MHHMVFEKSAHVSRNFIKDIEQTENLKGLENIFEAEDRLLQYLYKFDKNESLKEAKRIVHSLESSLGTNKLEGLNCYFVSLAAIITRYLQKNKFTVTEAFAFNTTCCELIKNKLTNENAVIIANELIELFIYVLADRMVPTFSHETVNKVIYYIDEHVESPISVEEIAKKFDVSTSHLSRIFRQHVGVTLVEYINIRKVEESQYYLRFTSKKIADISEQFYFCNQSYFTRIFKKYIGETPRRFRNHLDYDYFSFSLQQKEFETNNDE